MRAIVVMCAALLLTRGARAQSIDDLLDTQRYLDGLSELHLPEVLEHYIATHPSADPAVQAQYAIARQRMALRRPGITPPERADILRSIVDIRQNLIDRHPDDRRRVTWLADQSASWLFELFNIETAGWTALLGAPSQRQHQIASEAARHAYDLAKQATEALHETLLEIESQPGFVDDVAAQLRRQRLIERERRRRLPLLRGIASVVHAELNVNDPAQRSRLYRDAVEELGAAIENIDGAAACHARLHLGYALLQLDRYERAIGALKPMMESRPCGRDLPRLAELVQAGVSGRRDGPDAALAELNRLEQSRRDMSLLHRVLLTDQRFRWRKARADAATDPAQQATLLAEAYHAYLELLHADVAEPASVVRTVVINRIANVAGNNVPIDELPALVTVALAEAKARQPETRGEAIEMLRAALDRPNVDDAQRAAALYSLGRALHEAGRTLEAARRFIELARQYPDDPQSEQAIELGASLATSAFKRVGSAQRSQEVLGDALDVLFEQYPNLAGDGRWHYIAGELATRQKRYEQATELFKAVPQTSDQQLDAQFMLGNVARLRAESIADELKRISANEHAVEVIREVRTPIVQALSRENLSERRRNALRYYRVYLDVFEARSLLELTDARQALSLLERIELDPSLDPEARAEVLLARINAYQQLGRASEAQDQLRRYLEAAPEQVGAVVPPMMLDIERAVRELREYGLHEEAQTKARSELLPLANLLAEWLDAHPDARIDEYALRRRMAAAFELSGAHQQALLEYDRLLARHPNMLGLLVGKAESLFHMGGEDRLGEAIVLYKRIGASERSADSSIYWLAQLRMLQILDKVGRNTDQILPRIEQLEQRDPEFGGRQWQEQFNALRRKYR